MAKIHPSYTGKLHAAILYNGKMYLYQVRNTASQITEDWGTNFPGMSLTRYDEINDRGFKMVILATSLMNLGGHGNLETLLEKPAPQAFKNPSIRSRKKGRIKSF